MDGELTFTVVGNTTGALVTGTHVSGTDLGLILASDASGSADLTVRATDPLGLYVESQFTLTVLAINDGPTAVSPTFVSADEDAAPTSIDLGTVFDDIDNTDGELTFEIVSNDNALLFATVAIAGGALVLTHAADKHGQANIVVRATDPGGLTAEATLAVTVNPVNDGPVTSGIADFEVDEDAVNSVIDLWDAFSDVDNTDAELTFTVQANSNPGLVGTATVDNGVGTLTLGYAADAHGTADLTIRATDPAGEYVETTFTVTVNPINDAPTGALADFNVDEDAADTVLDLFAAFSDLEDLDADLTYTIQNNTHTSLFSATTIDGIAGTLTLGYAPNQNGTSDITVRATDSAGAFVETTFTVTVNPINDAPTTSGLADITVDEDSAATLIDLTPAFSDLEEDSAGLTYQVVGNSNESLLTAQINTLTNELVLSYQPDASGTALVDVRATDSGGLWVEAQLSIAVDAVNDAPTIEFLRLGPEPAIRNADLTLRAEGVADDGSISSVMFYRDADGDGQFNALLDQSLGEDTDGNDGWEVTTTASFGEGAHTYFAVATDGEGEWSAAATASGSVGIIGILDNGAPGYAESGSGWVAATGGFGGSHQAHVAGSGANGATWTFSGLLNAPHIVQVTWSAASGNATNAKYNIYDGATCFPLATVPVSGNAITVELTDDADGIVVADAVRLVDAQPEIGSLEVSPGQMNISDSVTLTAHDVTDQDGTVIKVRFYRDTNDDGIFNASDDQLLATDEDGGDGWSATVAWSTFNGIYRVGEQRYFAVAEDDTAQFSEAATGTNEVVPIIDDGDSGFVVKSGAWSNETGGHLGDARSAASGSGEAVVEYTFTGLAPGQYQLSATWFAEAGHATNAAFTILDGGSEETTVTVNQQLAPQADAVQGSTNFELLGGPVSIVSGTLTVRLTNDADGTVLADAIRLETVRRFPVAVDDTAVTNEDESVTIDVLANDIDLQPTSDFTVQSVTAISLVGDGVIETQGSLVEAVNLGQTTNRTVNGVTFTGSLTRDELDNSYSNAALYTDGNVSSAFHAMLDTFAFDGGAAGNPAQASITLTGLTAGEKYLVQLLVSDDRDPTVQTRTQSYRLGDAETGVYQSGLSYSLVATFTATGSTQDIEVQSWPGQGQAIASSNINGFQVRALAPVPKNVLDVQSVRAIHWAGDAVVETEGSLVEAVNLGQSANRTVNGVTFTGSLTRDDLVGSYSNAALYNDGNVSSAFQAMLDSFAFNSADVGNPAYATLTLTDLTIGEEYLVQLFVSDDRSTSLQTRTQSYSTAGDETAAYENGTSYSLTARFIATATTQDIEIKGFAGVGQTATAVNVNAFQVRHLSPTPQNALDVESVRAIGLVGDGIVETRGALIEAVNLGQSTDRTVGGVTFTGSLTRDDLASSYSDANLYTDGNVSADFQAMLDTFAFAGGQGGDPGQSTMTLTGLTAGETYMVQLFVSDDRTTGTRTRTQSYGAGGVESGSYQNGSSYSLVATFVATGSTQDIDIQTWPGEGQTISSANVNAFQVRQLSPTPPNALDVQSVRAIHWTGDSIVDTHGTLMEAVNLGQAVDRTVNGVTFVGTPTRDDLVSSYSDANLYNDGNVSSAFQAMLDSFAFNSADVGNPAYGTITLHDLVVGETYLVQLFVSDDRNTALETRTQSYTTGDGETAAYQNGLSYSLIATFTATETSQDIHIEGMAGVGQSATVVNVNAFQVRQVTGLEIQGFTQGEHGTVIENNNRLVYTPNADYNGLDSFTYTLVNAQGRTSTATVEMTINAVDDPPVVNSLLSRAFTDGGPHIVTLPSTDADGEAVTYTAVVLNGAPVDATINGNLMTLTLQSGSEGYNAPYEVTVTATDASNNETEQTLIFQSNNPQGLVINGSFEYPALPNENTWTYFSNIPGPVQEIPGWNIESGPSIEIQRNLLVAAADGHQYVELDAHPTPGSMSMSQAIATEVGATYVLNFAFAARPNTSIAENHGGVDLFDLGSDGTRTALDFTLLNEDREAVANNEPKVAPASGWSYYTAWFTATSTSTLLRFANLGPANTLGGFLDDVSVVEAVNTLYADYDSTGQEEASIYTRPINVEIQTGEVVFRSDWGADYGGGAGIQPTYRQTSAANPIIQREYQIPASVSGAETVEARLVFNGVENTGTTFYDVSALGNGKMVISLQADTIDLSTIDSGHFRYEIELTFYDSSDEVITGADEKLYGTYDLIDRSESEFGRDFWVDSLDSLVIDEAQGGVLLVRGDATAAWFAEDGDGGYITPDGSFTTLTKETDGSYLLTHTDQTKDYFNSVGLLQHRQDRNGNRITYTYTDADGDTLVDELATITDAFGLTTVYAYASNYLDTITDFAGRVTDYTITAGYVTQITLPDPDDTVSDDVPVVDLEWYIDSGDVDERYFGQLKKITLPEGNETTITYGDAGRFIIADSADGTDWFLVSSQTSGLAVGTTLTSPSGAYLPSQIKATYINELAHSWSYTVDAFGYETSMTDPLDFSWKYQRDEDGLMTRMTEPAGAGGTADLPELVTHYEYDTRGNLLNVTYAQQTLDTGDGDAKITESWEYDATFSQLVKHTDARGYQTINLLDANGNVEESRRQVEITATSYVNDPDKWITTKFDYTGSATYAVQSTPGVEELISLTGGLLTESRDGRGVLTSYVYFDRFGADGELPIDNIHHGLVTRVVAGIRDGETAAFGATFFTLNTDDQTVQHYTYDGNRNRASVIQQMDAKDTVTGTPNDSSDTADRETLYKYDDLNRLVQVTQAEASHVAPDGSTGNARPVTKYEYDTENFRVKTIDALGRVTETLPDEMLRLETIILPEAVQVMENAVGELQTFTFTPVIAREYDAAGNLTHVHDALDNYHVDDSAYIGALQSPGDYLEERSVTYAYNARNEKVSQTLPATADHAAAVTIFAYDAVGNLKSVKDALHEEGVTNRETTYVYDSLHRATKVTAPAPGDHPLNQDSDPNNDVAIHGAPFLEFVFDDAGNLVESNDAVDAEFTTGKRTTKYAYDGLNRLTFVESPQVFDAATQLATSPQMTYVYDAAHNLLSVTDAEFNITQFAYDALSRNSKITREATSQHAAPVTRMAYNDAFEMILYIDPLNRKTVYEFDNLGRNNRIIEPSPELIQVDDDTDTGDDTYQDGSGWGNGDASGYQGDYRISVSQTPGDAIWTFDGLIDGQRYEVLVTWVVVTGNSTAAPYTVDDGGGTTTVDIDQSAAPDEIEIDSHDWNSLGTFTVDGDTLSVSLTIDDFTQAVADAVVLRRVPTTEFAYDQVGNLRTVTDAEGNGTTREFDDLDRMVKLTEADPDGAGSLTASVHRYAFDVAGQLRSYEDPLNRVTEYGLDEWGRRVRTTRPDPDGSGPQLSPETTYQFDAVGNLKEVSERIASATFDTVTYGYDNLDRQVQLTDANGDSTYQVYDIADRMTDYVDPLGNRTGYDYDDLNRLKSETITVSSVDLQRSYQYDLVGNLKTYTDRNGRVIEYGYDELYRPLTEQWFADASDTTADHTIDNTWDIVGRLTATGDSFSAFTYGYDDLDRLTTEVQLLEGPHADALAPVIFKHQYDLVNNRRSTAAEIDAVDDYFTEYQYDDIYRMTGIEQATQTGGNAVAEKRVNLTYDAAHQVDLIKRYADLAGTTLVAQSDHDWDEASRLTKLKYLDAALATLADYDYQFDAADRVTLFDSATDGTADYDYDDRGQLTDADYDYQADEGYSYDENGNRTDYTLGDHNRVASDGTNTYLFDGEGNLTRKTVIASDAATVYRWDHRNRLVEVVEFANTTDADAGTNATKRVTQVYDVHDRWIGRFVDSDGDGTSVTETDDLWFVYDGNQIALQFEGTEGDGANASLEHRYLWGPNRDQLLVDEIVASLSTAGTVNWALTDNLGTVRDLVQYDDVLDETNNVAHFVYDAFGKITAATGTEEILFQFTGRAFDTETKLQYNSARWYNVELQRWMSVDPIGFGAGDPNLYRYVENEVTTAVDPSGLEERELSLGTGYLLRGLGGATVVLQPIIRQGQFKKNAEVFQDDGTVESSTIHNRHVFFAKYALANGVVADNKWYKVNVKKPENIARLTSKNGAITAGAGTLLGDSKASTEWFLTGTSDFFGVGSYEVRIKSFGETYEVSIRNSSMVYWWEDRIDANHFFERDWWNRFNDNFIKYWAEGVVDIYGDRLLGASYEVVIEFEDNPSAPIKTFLVPRLDIENGL